MLTVGQPVAVGSPAVPACRKILRRLWQAASSRHSPRAPSSPRRRSCRPSWQVMIWPKTGSTMALRRQQRQTGHQVQSGRSRHETVPTHPRSLSVYRIRCENFAADVTGGRLRSSIARWSEVRVRARPRRLPWLRAIPRPTPLAGQLILGSDPASRQVSPIRIRCKRAIEPRPVQVCFSSAFVTGRLRRALAIHTGRVTGGVGGCGTGGTPQQTGHTSAPGGSRGPAEEPPGVR